MEKEESVVVVMPVVPVMVGVSLPVWPGGVDFERADAVARCINWRVVIC